MQRMNGMDASFLTTETASVHNHVVGTLIVDPSTATDGFSIQKLKETLMARMHLLPPFRRKLVQVPFSLAPPLWIEDTDFDIDQHIRRVAVPSPGSRHELAELVGDIAGRPLDRSRPLWEMWWVEGLAEGHIALVTKMHHSAIDGVSGADLMVHLFDLTPEVTTPQPPDTPWKGEEKPSDWSMFTHALRSAVQTPGNLVRAVGNLAGASRGIVSLVRGQRGSDSSMTLPFTGPRTIFNAALTPHRNVAYGGAKLDDLKVIKRTFGTTINDVVLAASAGTLRDWLADHGGIPDKPLVAAVPVSVRTEEQMGDLGNRVSTMLVQLPVQIEDPVERLALIHENTKNAKAMHGALGAETIQQLAEAAPPALANLAARLYSGSKLADRAPSPMNLVVSNVPGPPIPLYCAGGQVLATYPMGPLLEGSGLNFTVLSNMGNLDFGLMACPELVPDQWQLADGFGDHIAILLKAAEAAGN